MTEFEEKQLNRIVSLLEDAGYDPIAQLQGYIEEKDSSYITRQGNARDIINNIDIKSVIEYYKSLKERNKLRIQQKNAHLLNESRSSDKSSLD